MAYCIIRNKAFEERAKRYNLSQDALEALEYSFYNTHGYSLDKEMPISFVDDYFLPVPISDKDIEVIKRDIIPSNVDLSNLSYKEAIELQNAINQYIGYEAVKPQHLNNGSYQIRLTLNDRLKYHQNASEYNSDESANEELETQILEDFNKHIQKPIDKRLNKHLTEVLEKFGVTTADIKKIKDLIPDGVLGVYDILNKVLYASEEGNKTTFVEEASHSLIEMLGAVYKPIGKKEDVTAFADYTRLYDLIEGTTLYSKVYEQYKDEYVKNGKPDIDKIKKEAIGQALATAIINNWERKEEEKDKSFWDKLKEFFDKILSIIKLAFSSNSKDEKFDPLERLLDDIAEDVISKKLKRFNKKDQSKYRLVTVESSLKELEKLDLGEALLFMQDASALGMIVTGSFSYRGLGTVYRKKGEILHDIDLVVNPSVHGINFSSGPLISAINRYKKIGEGDAILNFLAKQPILKLLIDKYNILLFTGYETSTGVITSGVFSKKYPELAKKFVLLKGSYENRIKLLKATPEQLANFYILDFFFEGNSENDYVYDAKNKLNFSKAQNSFKEKLKYGRAKDVVDYQRFKWYKEYRENKLSENVMFLVNPITYTEEQLRAIDTVVNSYNDKATPAVIIGKAGTGKTTVVAGIIEKIKEKMPPYTTPAVLVGALSHEAKGVLYSKLNWLEKRGIATVTAGSVAGILSKRLNPRTGKFERQFDFSTRKYAPTLIEGMRSSRGKVRPNIVFIDEASMLGEEDYKILCDEAKKFRVKIVFLGDTGLLEPPRSKEDLDKYNVKQDALSRALIDPNATTAKLTERIRQGEGHPLLDYADRYWEYSHHPEEQKYPNDIAEKTKINEKGALLLQQNFSTQKIVSLALPLFLQATEELNPNLCKIICYRTNDRDNYESKVSSYNAEIKRQLNAARGIVESTEYFVPGDLVIATENFAPEDKVLIENGLQFMVESVKSVVAYDPYFNAKIPKELKLLFKEVNVLTVTLINSEGNRYTVDALATNKDRVNHKYNFKLLSDYINQSSNNASYRDIASYKSDVANLDLAFAIGVHKSQGSTYEVAIIDASDINSVTKASPVTKARGIYTALTRASNVVVINSKSAQETKVYTNPKEINDWIKARKEGKNIPIPDFLYETVEVTPITEEEVSREVHNRKPKVTYKEINLSELFGTPQLEKVEPKSDNGWGGKKKLLEQSLEESSDESNDESNSENSSENLNPVLLRLLESGDFDVQNIDLEDDNESNSTLKDAFTNLSSYKERKEEVQRRLRDARDKTKITFYNDSHTYTVNGVLADYSVTEFVSSVFNIENHSIERKKDADIQKPLSIQEKEEKERGKLVKYKVATFPGEILDKLLREEFASIGTDQENLSEQAKVLRKNIELEIGSKDLIYITDEELLRVAAYVTVNGTKYLIAGTLDMLVVDSKGNKYIVDFKTKRENNAEEWRNDVKYKYKAQQELYGKMLSLEQDNVNENAYLAQFNVRYAWNNNYIERENQQDFVLGRVSLKAVMSLYRNMDDNDSIFAGPRFYALHNINSNSFNLDRNDLNSIEFSPVSNSTIIRKIKKQTQGEQVKALNTNLKNIKPAGKGRMNFSFNGELRDGVESKSTLAAIIKGERTATTRYKDIDYWKRVAKEGNIIEFYDSTTGHESRPHIYVRVTKSLHKLDENTDVEEWSKKEGWSVEHYNKSVLPNVKAGTAYLFEFEYLGIVPKNTENQQENTDNIKSETAFKERFNTASNLNNVIESLGRENVLQTLSSMQQGENPLTEQEQKSAKKLIGTNRPKVVMASEHTDPVFHAQKIIELVNNELKKLPKDRSFHMLQIMTKHDGLPLLQMLKLNIPKSIHFSITSLGGTKWEPGVMKMDDLLDRIETLINQGDINPNLVTIRIDPIIPSVTKYEDVEHIINRASKMGIRNFKFSVLDSYGPTEGSKRDRYIIKKMAELGYDWDSIYGRDENGKINFDAKEEFQEEIYTFMDDMAEKYKIFINTCGELPFKAKKPLKHIKRAGCLNVETINKVLGTNDVAHVENHQRPGCTCYGAKQDALRYDDTCASSCIYCYASHHSNKAMQYYNEDGTLKNNIYTSLTPKGENISSKGSEFAKKLTNVGNNISFKYKGRVYRNAEHAYQTNKSGKFDIKAYESTAAKPRGEYAVNKQISDALMEDILTAKFSQHPELVLGIKVRGGMEYLNRCTHKVNGDKHWETTGDDGFMNALRKAYQNVTEEIVVQGIKQTEKKKKTSIIDNQEDGKNITRGKAEHNSDTLYIFNDNTRRSSGQVAIPRDSWYYQRYGNGSDDLYYPANNTSAIIRGLDNARPLSTQRWYEKGAHVADNRWNNEQFEEFKKVIDQEVEDIKKAIDTGNYARLEFMGGDEGLFNLSISMISEERVPELYHYLKNKQQEIKDYFNNKTFNFINEEQDTEDTQGDNPAYEGSFLEISNLNIAEVEEQKIVNDAVLVGVNTEEFLEGFYPKSDFYNKQAAELLRTHKAGSLVQFDLSRPSLPLFKTIVAFAKNPFVYRTGSTLLMDELEVDEKTLEYVKKNEIFNYDEEKHSFTVPYFTTYFTAQELKSKRSKEELYNSTLLTLAELRNISKSIIYKLSDWVTRLNNVVGVYEVLFKDSTSELAKTDFTKLSRTEIIEKIGLGRILSTIRNTFFSNAGIRGNMKISTLRKIHELNNHWDALVELGYDVLLTTEKVAMQNDGRHTITIQNVFEGVAEDSEPELIAEIFGDPLEFWLVDFRSVDVMSSLSQLLRATFNTLNVTDLDGNIQYSEFGIEEKQDSRVIVAKLLSSLLGLNTLDKMIAKLEELKELGQAWVVPVLDKLNEGDTTFNSLFFSFIRKYFQPYVIIRKLKKGKGTKFVPVNTTLQNEVVILEIKENELGQINGLQKGNFKLRNKGGEINEDNYNSLNTLTKDLTQVLRSSREKELSDELLNTLEEILDLLDIPLPENEIFVKTFNNRWYVLNEVLPVISLLSKKIKEELNNKTLISDLYEYRKLVAQVYKNTPDATISVSYEAGKLYYSYVTPSYLNRLVEKLSSKYMSSEEYNEWIQKEYAVDARFYDSTTNSWRNAVLENLSTRPAVRKNFEHIVHLHYNGIPYKNMSPGLYIALMVKSYFYDTKGGKYAYYRVGLLSNKPSAEYIKYLRFGKDYKEEIKKRMFDVFLFELTRIKAVRERSSLGEEYKINNFDGKRGESFCFLDWVLDILNGKENINIYKKVENKLEDFRLALLNILSSNVQGADVSTISVLFEDLLEANMNYRFELAKQVYEDEGYITREKKNGKEVISFLDSPKMTMSMLEEFYWADAFMQIQLLQLFVGDIAQYKDSDDLLKRLAQLHSPGVQGNKDATDFYGNPVSDGFIRSIYLKDAYRVSTSYKNVAKAFDNITKRVKDKDVKDAIGFILNNILEQYKDINIADAQSITCPTSYRKKQFIFGKWTTADEDAYNILMNPESSDAELLKALKVLWQPLKPFVYTQTVINGNNKILPKMRIGRQEKNSEYVLILADALLRRAGQEDVLTAIYDFMEESHRLNPTKGIDSILFESAVKAGGQGILDLEEYAYENGQRNAQEVIKKLKNVYSGDDNIYKEHLVHVTPVEDYIIQQDNPPHFADHQQIAGSLNRALTFADLRDDEYIDDLDMTVGEARTIYNNAIKDNIEMSLAALKREFLLDSLDERALNIALSKLLKYQMLKDGRYGTDMLWAVDVNSYGYFNMPLSDPTVAPRIIQLIYSTIKNRINKQKFKGGPIVQMSCWGRSEELSVRFKNKKGEILYTEKEFLALQNNTADIKIQTEGYKAITGYNSYDEYIKDLHSLAYLECYAPIPYEGFLDDFGITLDSGEVVVDMEKVEREAPEYLKLIGYRIPTEAKYSMLPLKVVGFMPKLMGEGIMLPADLTLLTGSDFDVDKLYAMAMTLIKDKEGNFVEPKKGTILYNNNQILKIEYAVLTSSNNLRDILSPGNFEGIKEAAYSINLYKNSDYSWEDIQKNTIKENKALIKQNLNLVYNDILVKYFKQNMVAGHLVGISAVANVRHAFMTQAGDIAYIDLPDNMFTLNGVTIGGKTFIGNIYDLTGVKKISSNFALLIGATVDAVKDPVLNLININTLTINAAINLMTLGFSFKTIGLLLSQHIVDEVLKRATDTAMLYGSSPTSYHFNSAVLSLLADKKYSELYSSLLEFSTEDNILLENLKNRTDERDFVILKILDKLAQIDDPMREITNVTRFNSYVASFGPNVGNAWNKMDLVEAFLNDDMIPKDLKNWWLNHPILNTFYEASVECHNLLVKKNFKQASDLIRNAIKILKNKTGYLSEKDINAFIDFFMSAYVSQDNNGNYLFPTNSKAIERGMSEKEFMLTEFPHIFINWKKSNSIDNIFIKNIRLQTAEEGKNSEEYDSLQLNLRRFNTTVKEDIMKAWQTLLSDLNIITRNMAKRVFEYWFFRGGIGFSPKTTTYAAPNLLKKQLNSYVAILSNQNSLDSILTSNQDLLDRVIDLFILHNLSLVKHKYNKDFSSYGNVSTLIDEDNLFEGEIVTFKYKPYVLTKDGFIKVDALGGNNEGFELDLSVDYPDSIFTQSNNTNDTIEDEDDEEKNTNNSIVKYNLHKEDVGVILDKLFDENDRANLLDTSKSSIERAKIIKKSIENNGYNSSFDVIVVGKVLNEFAEQLVGKDSEEIKRILNNTEKELEDLNLCKRK